MRSQTPTPLLVAAVVSLVSMITAMPVRAAEKPESGSLDQKQIRTAVHKSIQLLQRSAVESTKHRQCFMCHHQAMPMIAVRTAQRHGIDIDQDKLDQQREHTWKFLKLNKSRFSSAKGTGGQADTAGYALWTLEEAEHPADDVTSAVVHYLLERHKDLKYWKTSSNRPPSEVSSFTTTYLAIRALKYYGNDKQQDQVKERLAAARKWILDHQAKDTEDHVFRLQSLFYLRNEAADKSEDQAVEDQLKATANALRKLQRDDGGWAQKPDMASDAYATGSTLVALQTTGQLKTTDKTYQQGVRFLLDTQNEDGSWHVVSRSKPFQKYFESGFPHKNDQFISATASSWATAALALCLPEEQK